jgi:hypothetical protein
MLKRSHLVIRLDSSPYAAVLTDGVARMRHLLWRTVPLKCPSACTIVIDKSNKALRGRVMKLLNVVKFVPSVATCSKDDAVAWLLKNPSLLSAIAKAESCGQPASPADFYT